MGENLQQESKLVEQIFNSGGKNLELPLYSFLDPMRPVLVHQEEALIRRNLAYLGGRRWGLAREEREALLKVRQDKFGSSVPVTLLECLSSTLQGKVSPAISAYEKAWASEEKDAYLLDFYILRELIEYLSKGLENSLPEVIGEDNVEGFSLFLSPLASSLYRSKYESSIISINEIGQLSDIMIHEYGLKRYIAIFLRALQGNRLLERGEFVWAERILSYSRQIHSKHMNFNESLGSAINRDAERVQEGLKYLSYQ